MKAKAFLLGLCALTLASCGGSGSSAAFTFLPVSSDPIPSSTSNPSSGSSSTGTQSTGTQTTGTGTGTGSQTAPTSSTGTGDTSGSTSTDTGTSTGSQTSDSSSTDTGSTTSSSSIPEFNYTLISDHQYNKQLPYLGFLFIDARSYDADKEYTFAIFDDGNQAVIAQYTGELERGFYKVAVNATLTSNYPADYLAFDADEDIYFFDDIPLTPSFQQLETVQKTTTIPSRESTLTPVYLAGYLNETYNQTYFRLNDDCSFWNVYHTTENPLPKGSYLFIRGYRQADKLIICEDQYGDDISIGVVSWAEDYSQMEFETGESAYLSLKVSKANQHLCPTFTCDDPDALVFTKPYYDSYSKTYSVSVRPQHTGDFIITATIQGQPYETEFHVPYDKVESAEVPQEAVEIYLGETVKPNIVIHPATARQDYVLSTSDSSIISIVDNCYLTAKKTGTATIYVYAVLPNGGRQSLGQFTAKGVFTAQTMTLGEALQYQGATPRVARITGLETCSEDGRIYIFDPNAPENKLDVTTSSVAGTGYVSYPSQIYKLDDDGNIVLSKTLTQWSNFIDRRISLYCVLADDGEYFCIDQFYVDYAQVLTETISVDDNCAELGIPAQDYTCPTSGTRNTSVSITVKSIEGNLVSAIVDHGNGDIEDVTSTLTFTVKKVNEVHLTFEKRSYVEESRTVTSTSNLRTYANRFADNTYEVEGMRTYSYGVYKESNKIQFSYQKTSSQWTPSPSIGFLLPANARLTAIYIDMATPADNRIEYSIGYGMGEDKGYSIEPVGSNSWKSLNKDDRKLQTTGGFFFKDTHGAVEANYVQITVYRVNDSYDMTYSYGNYCTNIRIAYILLD